MSTGSESLDDIQRNHLAFCETYAKGEISGVNILPALSYHLIQVLNHLYLQGGQSG